MTHEILIAQSRHELEWLDRKDQYHQMLFDHATRKYPACLLLMDALARKEWVAANHLVFSILTYLIADRIIDAKSKTLEIFLPSFDENRNINDIKSTIGCMSSIRGILFNCYYGDNAVIDISPFKKKSVFGTLFRKKEEVSIHERIAFPVFPEKLKDGVSAIDSIDDFVSDFVARIGYYSYIKSKTRDVSVSGFPKLENIIISNRDESNIPVGLSGKINQSFTELRFGYNSKFSFHRTLRVPETSQTHKLPADLGALPIHRIEDYADKVPAHWLEDGGLFIPLYQKEALFIQMEGNIRRPSIAKVCVGRINAVTGDSFNENVNSHKQDYVIIPHQKWLDGINLGNGIVRQFVAMPLGQGYTVEAQLTDEETFGGFQLILYPPKEGLFLERDEGIDSRIKVPEQSTILKQDDRKNAREIPPSQKPPLPADDGKLEPQIETTKIDKVRPYTTGALYSPSAQSQPAIGIAAGGQIQQQIYPDIFGSSTWNAECRRVISIRLVNSIDYKKITGFDPPPSPITSDLYQKSGLPWFSYFDENVGAVQGSKTLNKVQSIGEIERRRGVATTGTAPQPMSTKPRIIRTPEVSEILYELRKQAKNYLESMNLKECLRSITMVLSLEKCAIAHDYVIRSKCNLQLGYAKEAFIDACLALEIDPNCIEALSSRASCRLLLGDYDGAEEDAYVLASIPQTEPLVLAIQAELLILNNRFQDAVYAALRALKMYPDNKKLKDILEKARVESVRHHKNVFP